MTAPLFEVLSACSWSAADAAAVAKYTKKKKATDWNKPTLSDVRTRLREELIKNQRSACAYCHRLISLEIGMHDVDHILAKGIAGYQRFTYERMNLVATCKRCNRSKWDLDICATKPVAATAAYPDGEDDFLWVHPYIHRYSDHIRITEGLFEAVGTVDQRARGTALIDACGLRTLAGIEHRRAAEKALYATRPIDAVTGAVGQHPLLTDKAIVTVLRKKRSDFRGITKDAVLRIVNAYREGRLEDFAREVRAQGLG